MSAQACYGASFLVQTTPRGDVFCREQFDDIQREFGSSVERFCLNEVMPKLDQIENRETMDVDGKRMPVIVDLFRRVAELGVFSVDVSEDYDGLGLDKSTSAFVSESMMGCPSFSITIGAHAGIGTLPIVLFGNKAQKQKYLPPIMSGEKMSCYALTEPGSGSDALSGKTKAQRSPDGKFFVLNGEKQFITNGGWADVAIVFAVLDGKYSSFIVELDAEGVEKGAEEKKLGLKGSSTTNLIFTDAKVPVENQLGETGNAATIAFNILNLGRMKLGFSCLGNAKYCINETIRYAKDRKQFGQTIVSFDMQKAKLADMVSETYAVDSVGYRSTGMIDEYIKAYTGDLDHDQKAFEAAKEFCMEASILKVFGSEAYEFVLHDCLRMYGGYGFSQEYGVERLMRDNVVDTIFEGTNDVNRLVIFDTFAKRALGGRMPFRTYLESMEHALEKGQTGPFVSNDELSQEMHLAEAARRLTVFCLNRALIECGKDIRNTQQVMRACADLVISTYAIDSAVARLWFVKESKPRSDFDQHKDVVDLVIANHLKRMVSGATELIHCISTPERRSTMMAHLGMLVQAMNHTFDAFAIRRRVADFTIETGAYPF